MSDVPPEQQPPEQQPPPPEPAVVPPPKPTLLQLVRRAPVASLIIAINVVVFILAERTGSTTHNETLLRFGAVWRSRVWQGEYWRLATAMFLHIGGMHLLMNGYYGFLISSQVEMTMGAWRFLALYLLSGIAGSAASVIGHNAVSAGASGALFGLIGWQVMVARARAGSVRAMWNDPAIRRQLTWIGGWFVIGLFARFDNYAHAGGLAFGLLFTWALMAPPARRWRRLIVALISLAALVALSLRPLPGIHQSEWLYAKAHRKQNDPAAVLAITEPLLVTDWRIDAQRLRVGAFITLGRFQEAADAASEIIDRDPKNARAYLARGAARWSLGDSANGETDFQSALALDSSPSVRDTVAWYRNHPPK
jgi:rhomboid protease GluP